MKKSSAKFFGKSLLALALGIIAVAGLAVAGLLSYYGKVVGTATVSQSVQVSSDGNNWLTCTGTAGEGCTISDTFNVIAGNTEYKTYYVKNNAGVAATIKIDDDGSTPSEVEELGVAVVDTGTDCDDSVTYTNILGSNGPLIETLNSGPLKKICEKVKFRIDTLAGSYNVVLTVAPG
jgi:hypothetical protein